MGNRASLIVKGFGVTFILMRCAVFTNLRSMLSDRSFEISSRLCLNETCIEASPAEGILKTPPQMKSYSQWLLRAGKSVLCRREFKSQVVSPKYVYIQVTLKGPDRLYLYTRVYIRVTVTFRRVLTFRNIRETLEGLEGERG